MIYVLGSISNEMTLELERYPKRAETINADACEATLGGKGACQAVAIARLGGRTDSDKPIVRLIGRVGNDPIGKSLVDKINAFGVDTTFVKQVNRNTGMRTVMTTDRDRRVIVYNGANSGISKTDVDEALDKATSADTLLCQLEVPLYIVMYALRKARMIGMTTVLNPSPATKLPDDLYYNIDMIVPNAAEARLLSGITPTDFPSQMNVIRYFHARGVQYVVLTLGERGATISDGAYIASHVPARKVDVVDTTAAGDAFVGGLALTYPHIGMYSFEEACKYATKAAALTVSRFGGADSVPTGEEVASLYIREIQ